MKINFNGSESEELNNSTLVIPENLGIKTLRDVLSYIYKEEKRSHSSFFRDERTLLPGTLCLINETDSEILGDDQNIPEDSTIVLISTLHGG